MTAKPSRFLVQLDDAAQEDLEDLQYFLGRVGRGVAIRWALGQAAEAARKRGQLVLSQDAKSPTESGLSKKPGS